MTAQPTPEQLAKWRDAWKTKFPRAALTLRDDGQYTDELLEENWRGFLRAKQENERMVTHAEGCHTWGSAHYECALRRIAELEAKLAVAKQPITANDVTDACTQELWSIGRLTHLGHIGKNDVAACINAWIKHRGDK